MRSAYGCVFSGSLKKTSCSRIWIRRRPSALTKTAIGGRAYVSGPPHAYVGEAKGWKLVANPKLCGRSSPCVIVADRKYADANPEVTARFLSVYMRAMNMLQNEPLESLDP